MTISGSHLAIVICHACHWTFVSRLHRSILSSESGFVLVQPVSTGSSLIGSGLFRYRLVRFDQFRFRNLNQVQSRVISSEVQVLTWFIKFDSNVYIKLFVPNVIIQKLFSHKKLCVPNVHI